MLVRGRHESAAGVRFTKLVRCTVLGLGSTFKGLGSLGVRIVISEPRRFRYPTNMYVLGDSGSGDLTIVDVIDNYRGK